MGDGPAQCIKSQAVIRRMIAHNIVTAGQDVYWDYENKTYRGLVGDDGCIHLGIDRFGSPNVFASYIYRKILDNQGIRYKPEKAIRDGWKEIYNAAGVSLYDLRMKLPENLRGFEDEEVAREKDRLNSIPPHLRPPPPPPAETSSADQEERKRAAKRKRGEGPEGGRSGSRGGRSDEGSESGDDAEGDRGQAGGSSAQGDGDGGDDDDDAEGEESRDKESRAGEEEEEAPAPRSRSKKAAQPADSEEDEDEGEGDWRVRDKELFFLAIKDAGKADLKHLRGAVPGKQPGEIEKFYERISGEIREWYQPTGCPCGLDGDAREQAKSFLLWWEAMKRLEWLTAAKREIQSDLEEAKDQLETEIEEKRDLTKSKAKLEGEVKELRKTLKAEQKARQGLEESKKRAEKEADKLRKDGDKSVSYQKTIRKLEQQIEEMKREFTSEKDTRTDSDRQIRQLRKQLDQERKARADDADTRKRLESNLEKAKNRMEVLYADIDTARSAEAHSKQLWNDGRRKVEAQVAQMQKAIEGLRGYRKALEDRLKALSDNLKAAKPDWDESQLPALPEFQEPVVPAFDFSLPAPQAAAAAAAARPSGEGPSGSSSAAASEPPVPSPKDGKDAKEGAADKEKDKEKEKEGSKKGDKHAPHTPKPVPTHRRKCVPRRAPRAHDTLPGGVLAFNFREVAPDFGGEEADEA
eukprot:tig00021073_g18014.t1